MKTLRILTIIFFASLTGLTVDAQTSSETATWSLKECIEYAKKNNLKIKQIEDNTKWKEIELSSAKSEWLPSLNIGAGHNFDFGRSPTKEGVIVDRNSANSSLGINTGMPLFTGMRITNTIGAKKLELQAAFAALDRAKEDLSIQVAQFYIQALYFKELLNVAELQINLTSEQLKKTEILYQAGKIAQAQLYDMKAQQAKDEVTLTDAQNNYELAILNLTQALDLNETESKDFDIENLKNSGNIDQYLKSLLPPDEIFHNAVMSKPAIKEQELLLGSSKKQLAIAKSGYYPTLNLSASYSNGYFNYYDDSYPKISFKDQINQNERKTIGLSLSIPIFNRFRVRNQVRSAKVQIHNQSLRLDESKKNLYKEIMQAYQNAISSEKKFYAAEKAVDASKEAYSYAEERYESGKLSVFEYNESKTKYAQSLAQLAQSKFDFILKAKILDFYNGNPIEL